MSADYLADRDYSPNTPTPEGWPNAHLVEHSYSITRRPFVTVECLTCLVVLNSGHHYVQEHRHHAERLRDEHNARRHEAAYAARADLRARPSVR